MTKRQTEKLQDTSELGGLASWQNFTNHKPDVGSAGVLIAHSDRKNKNGETDTEEDGKIFPM